MSPRVTIVLRKATSCGGSDVTKHEGTLDLFGYPRKVGVVPSRRYGREYAWLDAQFWIVRGIVPTYIDEVIQSDIHSAPSRTEPRQIEINGRQDIPTPKPSPLIGRLRSNRRRESKAWLMIECAGRVKSYS